MNQDKQHPRANRGHREGVDEAAAKAARDRHVEPYLGCLGVPADSLPQQRVFYANQFWSGFISVPA